MATNWHSYKGWLYNQTRATALYANYKNVLNRWFMWIHVQYRPYLTFLMWLELLRPSNLNPKFARVVWKELIKCDQWPNTGTWRIDTSQSSKWEVVIYIGGVFKGHAVESISDGHQMVSLNWVWPTIFEVVIAPSSSLPFYTRSGFTETHTHTHTHNLFLLFRRSKN